MADGGQEPSMEDILSSIKRIIAEDSDAALSGSRARRSVAPARSERTMTASNMSEQDDVLELTDLVAVEPLVQPQTETQPPAQPPADAPAEIMRTPEPAAPPPSPKPDKPLVSNSTVEASRSALAALSALVVKPEVTGSDSLEGLVREMLRPMIAQWLDARLPEIVERQVADEVRKIAARG